MRTTHHLTEAEIKQAITAWVKTQDERAETMDVSVVISHDQGEPPYNQSSFTAAATLTPRRPFEGKD
jgi:4-hydroxy-L-threonine phosphate dehydrogenase PdxA